MNLKTYQADSMAQALALVKKDLGSGAVILHTRTFKTGGLMGFGAKTRYEVTASNDVSIVPPKLQRNSRTATAANPSPQAAPRRAASLLARTYQQQPHESALHPNAQAVLRGDAAPAQTPVASPSAPADPSRQQLDDEIRQIRRMVDHMVRTQAAQPKPNLPDKLFHEYLALLEQEVTQELAHDVIENVKQTLGPDQMDDPAKVRRAVNRAVAEFIPVSEPIESLKRRKDNRPFILALIGPTGVGKTTTVAKLAATFKLRQKKRVGLITIDTYRIAAVDQLKTYADIIGLPLHVVTTPGEMKQAIEKCRDCDVVLIDTAGRSQRDDNKLSHLSEFIEAAAPDQVHLVLSSTAAQSVNMETAERFARLRTDRIIFTKLDEAVSFGVLLNVVRKVNKQLSFLTTGQEVPHQIEPASRDRVADLILGGRL